MQILMDRRLTNFVEFNCLAAHRWLFEAPQLYTEVTDGSSCGPMEANVITRWCVLDRENGAGRDKTSFFGPKTNIMAKGLFVRHQRLCGASTDCLWGD
jgi:hypothetical protein